MAQADRLLPGEDPLSGYVEDADLWIEIYSELIAVTSGLMARLPQPTLAGAGTATADTAIAEQLERFERRLAFWKSRRIQLSA